MRLILLDSIKRLDLNRCTGSIMEIVVPEGSPLDLVVPNCPDRDTHDMCRLSTKELEDLGPGKQFREHDSLAVPVSIHCPHCIAHHVHAHHSLPTQVQSRHDEAAERVSFTLGRAPYHVEFNSHGYRGPKESEEQEQEAPLKWARWCTSAAQMIRVCRRLGEVLTCHWERTDSNGNISFTERVRAIIVGPDPIPNQGVMLTPL